jgi:hypothetical protein
MATKSNKSRRLTWVHKAQEPSVNRGRIIGNWHAACPKASKTMKSGRCDKRVLVVRIADLHQFGVSASGIETTAETNLNRKLEPRT